MFLLYDVILTSIIGFFDSKTAKNEYFTFPKHTQKKRFCWGI